MDPALIAFLVLIVLMLGVLIGFFGFYLHFLSSKEASHKAMDERGVGRRLR